MRSIFLAYCSLATAVSAYETSTAGSVGWIYKGPAPTAPDLSSYYTSGRQVLPLAEIKAAGANFVQAWVDFAG
jgi:hypothetical protein